MKNQIRTMGIYALLLIGGLGLGYALPRIPAWLKPAYAEGNYRAHFPNAQTKVVLYSTSWCGYCAKTRAYFAENKVDYLDLDIEKSPLAAKQFAQLSGEGVPKVVIGNRLIWGYAPKAFDAALKELR